MFALIPLLIQYGPQVIAMMNNPTVQALLPAIQQVLGNLGSSTFPGVDPAKSHQAGASLFDMNAVKWVQTSLNLLGEKLTVDGVADSPEMKAAVVKYQQAKGNLVVDGWAGQATQDSLRIDLSSKTLS